MELSNLIYNRTYSDVVYAKNNPNSDEDLKGTLNYSDLNRIEEWVCFFKYTLPNYGYDTSELEPKVTYLTYDELPNDVTYGELSSITYYELTVSGGGWTVTDIPTLTEITRVVNNIENLRNMFTSLLSDLPKIEFDGSTLNYTQLNIIEEILYLISKNYMNAELCKPYVGTFYAGEEEILI